MLDELCKVEDKVIVTIPRENREWGYNPCPDGTKAEIVGFTEIYKGRINNFGLKPGVYVNRSWAVIRLPDGEEYAEWTGRLELIDKVEEQKRLNEYQSQEKTNKRSLQDREEFLRELPETPFWEGDIVSVSRYKQRHTAYQIVGIDYSNLTELTDLGTKYPVYHFSDSLSAGWFASENEDGIALIKRGKVWQYYHHEPIQFESLEEEANLHLMLGLTEEVRNPVNQLFSWTLEEVLEAIKDGLVHGFIMSTMFGSVSIDAIRFCDEDLGKRVVKTTLDGFFKLSV